MTKEQWVEKFLGRLRAAGRRGLTRGELSSNWNWFRYQHNREASDPWIAELIEGGKIKMQKRPNKRGGPDPVYYRLSRFR